VGRFVAPPPAFEQVVQGRFGTTQIDKAPCDSQIDFAVLPEVETL
jgi:hypothetical protein